MSAGEIAISDDPRAQKIYEGFRMCASPLSLSPAPPLSPLVPLRSLSFLRAPPPVCRIAPGVLVRVSPGRGALPTLAATHANNPFHTLRPAQRCDQHAGRHDRQPGVGVRLGLVRGNYCRLSRLSVSLRRPRPSDGCAQRAGAVDRRGGSDAVCGWVPQGQNVVRERDGRCARVAALRTRPCCRFPQRSRHLVITQMRACGGAVCAQCTSRRQSWRAKQCHGS